MAFGEPVLELERGLRYRDHERQVEQQLEPRRLPMAFAMAARDDRPPPCFRLQHLAVPRRRAAAHASPLPATLIISSSPSTRDRRDAPRRAACWAKLYA